LRYPDELDTFTRLTAFAQPTFKDEGIAASTQILFDRSNQEAVAAHDPRALVWTVRYPGSAKWFEGGHDDGVWRKVIDGRAALVALAPRPHLLAASASATCTSGKP
jgi:hypothetical protein